MKSLYKLMVVSLLMVAGCAPAMPETTAAVVPTSTNTPQPVPTITPSYTPVPRIEGVLTRNSFLFDCTGEGKFSTKPLKKDATVMLRGSHKGLGIVSEYNQTETTCALLPLRDLYVQQGELPEVDLPFIEYGDPLVEIDAENARHLGEVLSIGNGVAKRVLFSFDSKFLAVTTPLGVHLYDGTTFEFVKFIETPSGFIGFSGDGRLMYTASSVPEVKKKVKIWSIPEGSLNKTIDLRAGEIHSFLMTPDGRNFITAGTLGVNLWNPENGELVKKITPNSKAAFAIFSNDGRYVAVGLTGSVQLYSVDDGSLLWENKFLGTKSNPDQSQSTEAAIPQHMTFSPDGSTVTITGGVYEGQYDTQNTFQTRDGIEIKKYPGYPFLYSPNGQVFAENSCSIVCIQIRTLDFKVVKGLYTVEELLDNSYSPTRGELVDMAYSPNGKFLAAASGGGAIRIWETESYSEIKVILDFSMPVRGLSVSSDGGKILTAESPGDHGFDNRAEVALVHHVWDNEITVLPQDESGFVYDVAYYPNDTFIAITTEEKGDVKTYLVHPDTLELVEKYPAAYGVGADTMSVSQDGSVFAISMLSPNRIYAWETGSPLEKLVEIPWSSSGGAPDIAVSSKGEMLAFEEESYSNGTGDYRLNLFDVAKHTNHVLDLPFGTGKFEFLPGTDTLVLAFANWEAGTGEIQLWNTNNLTRLSNSTQDFNWDYKDIAISPNGQLLALTTLANEIKVFKLDGKVEIVSTLAGHVSAINKIAFSRDGRFLVSGGEDGIIKLWAVMP